MMFFIFFGQIAHFFSDIQIPVNNPEYDFLHTVSEKTSFSKFPTVEGIPFAHSDAFVTETYENGDYIDSNGFLTLVEENSVNQFHFPFNNSIEITSALESEIQYHFNYGVANSTLSLELDKIAKISIDLAFEEKNLEFSKLYSSTEIEFPVEWLYQTVIQVKIPEYEHNDLLNDSSMMYIPLDNLLQLNPSLTSTDFIPIMWDPFSSLWSAIELDIVDSQIAIPLSSEYVHSAIIMGTDIQYFTILNKHPGSIVEDNNGSFSISKWIPFLLGLGVIIVIGGGIIAMSSTEYRHLVLRTINPNYGMHRLNMNEVFENENRKKIIDFILLEPGIHFNDLKRKCGLQGGQLVWHINMLESYGIIHLRKVGQFVVYFPTIMENLITDSDLQLLKSRTTISILHLIQEFPEITASEIAKILKLGRNTVKYHVDKLIAKNIISTKQVGRKKKLFCNRKE